MTETLFDLPPVKKTTNQKRNWENRFQRWSDKRSEDGHDPYGCCGTGGLCDYCKDNDYGRPCVRALNTMCRVKKIKIDYTDLDFEKVWWLNGLREVTDMKGADR